MSYIEFQVSTSAFLAAQRNALRAGKAFLCPPPPIPVGPLNLVLDRIEFGGNAIRHDVETTFAVFYTDHGETLATPNPATGFQTQIAQDVTVFVSDLNDILTRPNQPPAVSIPITGTLVFDVDFYALGDDCYLRITFSRFEPGPLPAIGSLPVSVNQILQMVNQRLASAIPSPAFPAGLGKLSPGGEFLNAGVSVDTQLGRIAFRAQIGGSYSSLDVPWTNFFRGNVDDRLQGKDWSLSVDAGLIVETLKTRVSQALDGEDLPPDLHYYPGAYYTHTGGAAVFTLDVLAIYNFLDDVLDTQEDFKVPIALSVDAPNSLTLDIDLTQLLDFRNTYLRAILLIATGLGFPVESFVLGLLGSAVIGGLADEGLTDCREVSPGHIRCTYPARLPQVPGTSRATLTDLLALSDAVALAGTMVIPELTASSLQLSLNEFEKEIPEISCSSATMSLIAAFGDNPSGFKILHAKGFVENAGSAPLYMCKSPTVLNDPLGVFSPANVTVDSDQAPITISLDIPIPRAEYFAAPYPCDLLLETTGGTRVMRFAPLATVTAEDLTALKAELLVKVGDCHILTDPGTLHTGIDVHWLVDPPVLLTAHLAQILVAGVVAGDTVSVVDAAGTQLVHATSRSTTPLHLSVFVPPGGEKNMTIFVNQNETLRSVRQEAISQAPASEPAEGGARMGLKQTVLLHVGSVPLPGECLQLVGSRLEGGRGVMAVLKDGIVAYDFATPTRPVPVRAWQIDDLRGALDWQGGLLYFGREGLGTIDRQGRQAPMPPEYDPTPVHAAAADSEALYALTPRGLEVYSKHLRKQSTTPMDGRRSIVRVGRTLAIGGTDGVAIVDASDPGQPYRETLVDGVEETACLRPLPMEPGSFLAVLNDGSAKTFRWNEGALEETASYSQRPWFADSVRLSTLLVTIGKGRRTLDLYRFGPTQVI